MELLISSNIARYAEFRCVNRVLTWIGDVLEPVPCSRADVFATKHVSVVEKRMLMKLLTSFLEYEKTKEHEEFKGKHIKKPSIGLILINLQLVDITSTMY